MTIIDRDIKFYLTMVEQEERAYRTCPPSKEEYYQRRIARAKEVVNALQNYRAVVREMLP